MGILTYTALASLDGYIEDEDGGFGWATPDEEVHRFVNALERPIGTHLYGRRMYETMSVWETDPTVAELGQHLRDYAGIWMRAEKIVFSRTLEAVSTDRTRIEREFDPGAVGRLKESSAEELGIGGPELAAQAFRSGLVDECRLFIAPVVVGGGKHALPAASRIDFELLEQRRFGNGMAYLRYRTTPPA